jgi:hypothetical protein
MNPNFKINWSKFSNGINNIINFLFYLMILLTDGRFSFKEMIFTLKGISLKNKYLEQFFVAVFEVTNI